MLLVLPVTHDIIVYMLVPTTVQIGQPITVKLSFFFEKNQSQFVTHLDNSLAQNWLNTVLKNNTIITGWWREEANLHPTSYANCDCPFTSCRSCFSTASSSFFLSLSFFLNEAKGLFFFLSASLSLKRNTHVQIEMIYISYKCKQVELCFLRNLTTALSFYGCILL